jgi:aminoglycoside phosphotransferase (APT) family kinase protein
VAALAECAPPAKRAACGLEVCIIHGDILQQNVRFPQGRAVFVDWELARRSTPLLDLAMATLSFPDEARELLGAYARRRGIDAARLDAQVRAAAPLAAFAVGVETLESALAHRGVALDNALALLRKAVELADGSGRPVQVPLTEEG